MVLIAGKSKAGDGVGAARAESWAGQKGNSAHATRPMKIIKETPRLESKANVKLKGFQIGQNHGEPREYRAHMQSKVEVQSQLT